MSEHIEERLQSQAQLPTQTSSNIYTFTHSPDLSPFAVSSSEYVSSHRRADSLDIRFLAVGALVILDHTQVTAPSRTPSSPSIFKPLILLVKRASTDSLPDRWEIPGGACDETDATLLHSCARELHEEAGLIASHIHCLVQSKPDQDGDVFTTSRGTVVCKYSFLVTVDPLKAKVKLDPGEHQDYVWATKEEVFGKSAQGRSLIFTFSEQEQVIRKGFEVWERMSMQRGLDMGEGRDGKVGQLGER